MGMRLKVKKVEEGMHPSQVSVAIDAQDGRHFLVLNKASVDNSETIDVGNPVGIKDGYRLIELPEETDGGSWRVWVPEKSLVSKMKAAE
jgi:hypothetical protein